MVFGSIAQDMDGADISVVVDAMVGEGLTKGRDEGGSEEGPSMYCKRSHLRNLW